MIAFATLVIGLVVGPQRFELVAGEAVARVELRLDGRTIAAIDAPPWEADCQLGDALRPHEVVAIAYGAQGEELGRARQWLNLPHDPAVSQLILEDAAPGEGGGRAARLTWESTAGAAPETVHVTFDGQPLSVEDPRRFLLPPHDPSRLHFLRAELDFAHNVTSVAEMTFGGTYGDEISTEITAVPIAVDGKEPPTVDSLRGRFVKRGEVLRVVAVDQGPAEVVMVVDRSFAPEIPKIARSHHAAARTSNPAVWRYAAKMERDHRLRFVVPAAQERAGAASTYDLFPLTSSYSSKDAGVFHLLAEYLRGAREEGEQRLADAVAVAGLTAAGHRRRRAVVLVLGRQPEDASQLAPALARDYLAALRVPLMVWGTSQVPPKAAWGERSQEVDRMGGLEAAVHALDRDLDRQWVVWIDGVHLPQEIELAPGSRGLRLLP